MYIIEDKMLCFTVDKKDNFSAYYARAQIGKSADNFYTLSVELKDKSVIVLRLGDISKLAAKAGVLC